MNSRSAWVRGLLVFGFVVLVAALGFAYPLLLRGQELSVARYDGRWYFSSTCPCEFSSSSSCMR